MPALTTRPCSGPSRARGASKRRPSRVTRSRPAKRSLLPASISIWSSPKRRLTVTILSSRNQRIGSALHRGQRIGRGRTGGVKRHVAKFGSGAGARTVQEGLPPRKPRAAGRSRSCAMAALRALLSRMRRASAPGPIRFGAASRRLAHPAAVLADRCLRRGYLGQSESDLHLGLNIPAGGSSCWCRMPPAGIFRPR